MDASCEESKEIPFNSQLAAHQYKNHKDKNINEITYELSLSYNDWLTRMRMILISLTLHYKCYLSVKTCG